MFAVIKTGGKQYKVAKDNVISIEKLAGEPGTVVEFADVLMVSDGAQSTIGTPIVEGATVAGTVLDQTRADKIIVYKKKRRQNYRRKQGHRQDLTVVRITEILTDGKKPTKTAPVAKAAAAKEAAPTKAPAAKKTPAKKAAAKKTDKE